MRTGVRSAGAGRASAWVVALGLAAGLAAGLAGCGESERGGGASAGFEGPPAATYTTRGEVVSLPSTEGASRPLEIKHEAIDHFADKDGRVVGMNAMVMPFPLGPGVSLEGIEVGDKVEATFAVWWTPRKGWHLTAIRELPADTAMTYGRANPGGANTGAADEAAGSTPGETPSGS